MHGPQCSHRRHYRSRTLFSMAKPRPIYNHYSHIYGRLLPISCANDEMVGGKEETGFPAYLEMACMENNAVPSIG